MIGAAVLLGAIAYIAYKLGVANERLRHVREPFDLSEHLRRASASREWRA